MAFETDVKRQTTYGLGSGHTLAADVGALIRLNGGTGRGVRVQATNADVLVKLNVRLIGGEAKDPGGRVLLEQDSSPANLGVNNGGAGSNVFTIKVAHDGLVDVRERGLGIEHGVTVEIYDSVKTIWREYTLVSLQSDRQFTVDDVDGADYSAGTHLVRFRSQTNRQQDKNLRSVTVAELRSGGILVPSGESLVFGAGEGDDRAPGVSTVAVVGLAAATPTVAGGVVVPT